MSLDSVLENDKLCSTPKPVKTGFFKSAKFSPAAHAGGFTLLELVVVLGVIAVLIVVEVPVLAAGKSQSKIAVCASHVRQLVLATQIFANDNHSLLPVFQGGGSAWAWDLPNSTANGLLNSGTEKKTFYCPGTAPRFTDVENWAGPGNTLWGYSGSFHLVGYIFAFSGPDSKLNPTNQNTTIQPEAIFNFPSNGMATTYGASERVLVADAILSGGSTQPGYAHPENNFTGIAGGYTYNGMTYPHISPHLNGNVPAGGNVGFKDGHVDWRDFELMTPRTFGGPWFWW